MNKEKPKINKGKIILVISVIIIIAASVNAGFFYLENAEAQAGGNIEGYTEADKTVKFLRLQFDFYILASDFGDGDNFLNGIEIQRANKVIKSLPFKSSITLWCNEETLGEIYRVSGAYVFKNDFDASQIRDWLESNLPINKIKFAEFYLLENNHHWDKPTNDIIIQHKVFGNEEAFRQIELNC